MPSGFIPVVANDKTYSFLWLNDIPLYTNTLSSLSIHPLMDTYVACKS